MFCYPFVFVNFFLSYSSPHNHTKRTIPSGTWLFLFATRLVLLALRQAPHAGVRNSQWCVFFVVLLNVCCFCATVVDVVSSHPNTSSLQCAHAHILEMQFACLKSKEEHLEETVAHLTVGIFSPPKSICCNRRCCVCVFVAYWKSWSVFCCLRLSRVMKTKNLPLFILIGIAIRGSNSLVLCAIFEWVS